MDHRIPAGAVWALGVTQIIGYGTLYYSFGVVAPSIGVSFAWRPEWVFAALTVALLAGGLLAPVAGHLVDRFGAARAMAAGSVAAALTLAGAALASSGTGFAVALVLMEVSSGLVLYSAAFAALVQLGGRGAQRSITHLTLIAGFASTLFWPLTGLLLTTMDWRAVYLVFAALNLLICAPLHLWLSTIRPVADTVVTSGVEPSRSEPGSLSAGRRRIGFGLMLLGFAIEGFIISGMLMQIIPLLAALGLGGGSVFVTSLFGPAQVLSRLTNMLFGKELSASRLAVVAAALLPLGVVVLAVTAPALAGAVAFAVLFGLGSGLTSIVSGALPLQVLGRNRYGLRLGWLSAARQLASAVAPFVLALLIGSLGTLAALGAVAAIGASAIAVFVVIAVLARPTVPDLKPGPATG